jgi:hypothetical protein
MGFWGFIDCKSKKNIRLSTLKQNENSFDRQMLIFESLGYKFNKGINKDIIFNEIKETDRTMDDPEKIFIVQPFERLYYYLGWSYGYPRNYYTDDCIWYELEFIDPSMEYIEFMKRMGKITHGEILYSDIELTVDENDCEWINFKVNGILKKWRLAKVRYIDDSFFQRFSYITKELKTKGRYTFYSDGGQQFVIDYATLEEQIEFIKKTGLKREWLGEGNHFNEPKE